MARNKNSIAVQIAELRATGVVPSSPEEVVPEITSLAQKAASVLNYRVLLDTVKGGVLQHALAKLEIEVLDQHKIREYQTQYRASDIPAVGDVDDDDDFDDDDHEYSWRRVHIANYVQPIPEFALDMAVRLKQEVPKVEIYVEELRKHPDPFMVARLGNETYYFAVWAEPKFEGTIARDEKPPRSTRKS